MFNWTLEWNSNQNAKIFIQENALSPTYIYIHRVPNGPGQQRPRYSHYYGINTRKVKLFTHAHTIFWDLFWRHNDHDGVSKNRRLDCLNYHFYPRVKRKHQSSASLAFVRGIHRWPVDSPHKGRVTLKYFFMMTSSCWGFSGDEKPESRW